MEPEVVWAELKLIDQVDHHLERRERQICCRED
jgi:hypothetical protein